MFVATHLNNKRKKQWKRMGQIMVGITLRFWLSVECGAAQNLSTNWKSLSRCLATDENYILRYWSRELVQGTDGQTNCIHAIRAGCNQPFMATFGIVCGGLPHYPSWKSNPARSIEPVAIFWFQNFWLRADPNFRRTQWCTRRFRPHAPLLWQQKWVPGLGAKWTFLCEWR